MPKRSDTVAPLRHSHARLRLKTAQEGHRRSHKEVGLATGRTKLPGPDLLLRELERAAEKLEGGEPGGFKSHPHTEHILIQIGSHG